MAPFVGTAGLEVIEKADDPVPAAGFERVGDGGGVPGRAEHGHVADSLAAAAGHHAVVGRTEINGSVARSGDEAGSLQ